MITEKIDDQLKIAFNNQYKIKHITMGFDVYIGMCSELQVRTELSRGVVEYSGKTFTYSNSLENHQLQFVMMDDKKVDYFIY